MSDPIAGYYSISNTMEGKLSLDEFNLHYIAGHNSSESSIPSPFRILNIGSFYQCNYSEIMCDNIRVLAKRT